MKVVDHDEAARLVRLITTIKNYRESIVHLRDRLEQRLWFKIHTSCGFLMTIDDSDIQSIIEYRSLRIEEIICEIEKDFGIKVE